MVLQTRDGVWCQRVRTPPTLSLIVLNAGAMAVAVVAARSARLGGGTGALVVGTLCGYLIIVHSVVLLAGLWGYLNIGGVAMLLVIALVSTLWLTHRARHGRALPRIWANAQDGNGGAPAAPEGGGPARGAPRAPADLTSPPPISPRRWWRSLVVSCGRGRISSRPRDSGSGTTTRITWSTRRCGCASTPSPPSRRPRPSPCRPGILFRPASSPRGSCSPFRSPAEMRWPGSASRECSTAAS